MDNSFEIKLLILNFLSDLGSSVNLSEITSFLLESNLADYMQANQYLAELSESGLINEYQKENKVLYKINDQGKNTLEMFSDKISDDNRENIKKRVSELKEFTTDKINSSFTCKKDDNNYTASCSIIKEKNILFQIDIPNVSEKEAKQIEKNWDENKLNILKNIKENLM